MEAANCPRCGKVFLKIRDSICEPCVKAEEKKFEEVREYVKENPQNNIQEVSDACEVPVKRIMQYVRDGRLEATAGLQAVILCSKCNKPILTGRMCEKCVLDVNFQVNDMKEKNIKHKGKVFTFKDK